MQEKRGGGRVTLASILARGARNDGLAASSNSILTCKTASIQSYAPEIDEENSITVR